MSIVNGFFCLTFGRISKKIGVKAMLIAGVVSASLGYGGFSFFHNLPSFYICAVLVGFGIANATLVPLSLIISNWFVDRRGFALGIVFAASGIGGTFFNPIIGWMIVNLGWRLAIRREAMMILIAALPLAFIISPSPEDRGLTALGSDKVVRVQMQDQGQGLELSKARKTKQFYFALAYVFGFSMAISPVFVTMPSYLTDRGFAPTFAALVLSLMFLVNTFSKVLLGVVNDRFGLKMVLRLCYGAFFIADAFLILARLPVFAFAFAVFNGIAICLYTVPLPLVISRLFGQRDYANIMGLFTGVMTLGSATGVPLISHYYDATGSYIPAYAGIGILVVLSMTACFRALKLAEESGPSERRLD
jgi:MFS family permease